MEALTVLTARTDDLARYLDLLEGIADWLERVASVSGRGEVSAGQLTTMNNRFSSKRCSLRYVRAGFGERAEIEARFPPSVGTLRLQRYEKQVC